MGSYALANSVLDTPSCMVGTGSGGLKISSFTTTGATLISVIDNLEGTETVTLHKTCAVTSGGKRFVRILVTYP